MEDQRITEFTSRNTIGRGSKSGWRRRFTTSIYRKSEDSISICFKAYEITLGYYNSYGRSWRASRRRWLLFTPLWKYTSAFKGGSMVYN